MILKESVASDMLSEFMQYLAALDSSRAEQLPALVDLSEQLDISVASLREQLEVARALGLVDVRPRTGIRRLPYSFRQTIKLSLAYALELGHEYFQQYSDLRSHIETIYWMQATQKLLPEDLQSLFFLIERAESKLHGHPIQIPHVEHRELHLQIYKRLENPFVTGMLEAYWEMYEAVGLNVYADYNYLERVWQYHREMVEAIYAKDFQKGHQLLVEHLNLLSQRPAAVAVMSPAGSTEGNKKSSLT